MSIDTSSYYELTNELATVALEVDPEMRDGRYRLRLAQPRAHSGQRWKFVEPSGEKYRGKYRLCSAQLGDGFSLTCGSDWSAYLAGNSDNLDQALTLTHLDHENYSIKIGNIYLTEVQPFRRQGEYIEVLVDDGEGQIEWVETFQTRPNRHERIRWILRKTSPGIQPIPALGGGEDMWVTLDTNKYTGSKETVKGVMVFVDFMKKVSDPIGTAAKEAAQKDANGLLGAHNKTVQALQYTLFDGTRTWQVDVKSDLGWKQPSEAKTDSSFFDHSRLAEHRAYIAEAAQLFTPSEVSFSAYDFVVIVPPRQADLPKKTYTFRNETGADSQSGKIRWAVTYGIGRRAPMTLGPTNYETYKEPKGTVKAVMVFVDFQNAQAPTEEAGRTLAKKTADHLLGKDLEKDLGEVSGTNLGTDLAKKRYKDQSYGKLTLDVTVKSDLGWRRMPSSSRDYDWNNNDQRTKYIEDAAQLFTPSEVKFSEYHCVYIVAPQDAGFPLSPTRTAGPGEGASAQGGKIRLVVTFGTDSYTNRYINLVHEMGHVFGLPDLYPLGKKTYPPEYTNAGVTELAGSWSIMADDHRSLNFLGWERHKMGWLDAPRKTYLSEGKAEWEARLSPLSGNSGLSMVVLPLANPSKPSKVLVVEVAQSILGKNNKLWGEGVLLYTVDATKATGHFPIEILPKTISKSADYGDLHEAPFKPGDPPQTFKRGDVSITVNGDPPETDKASIIVKVLEKIDSSYMITIKRIDRKYTVFLTDATFIPASITIPKGTAAIALVNEANQAYTIFNGSSLGSSPLDTEAKGREEINSGAPDVRSKVVAGTAGLLIGPFNTLGTYHFFCTNHSGMKLTVIVQ